MVELTRMLLVVAKQPAPGQTKTRLCPPLTGEMAAQLYSCFLADTLDIMRRVPGVSRTIAYLPEDAGGYFRRLAPDLSLTPQRGESLGERLDHLIVDALANGAAQVVVMDSDSPTLPPAYVAQAFEELAAGADVVLGPCQDGGYYLVGMTRPHPRLLREVQMSTPTVLRDTLAIAAEVGARVALLPQWYDVDTVSELENLRTELHGVDAQVAFQTRRFLERLNERWNTGEL
jgi:uncharacterized protein